MEGLIKEGWLPIPESIDSEVRPLWGFKDAKTNKTAKGNRRKTQKKDKGD